MPLDASFFRSGFERVSALIKRDKPFNGFRSDVNADTYKLAAEKSLQDILVLSERDPAKAGAQMKNLKLTQVRSPLSLSGGHNPIQAMQDQFGKYWLFKSVFKRGANYRAVGDKVGADLARAVGIPAPPVQYASQMMRGKMRFGTLEPMVKHSGKRLSEDVSKLTESQKNQLMASHVFRWLIGDHDGKAANFLKMDSGSVVSIDFGNMYRNFSRDQLSRNYQPNPVKPLFNHMWDGYVSGKIDLDFRAGLAQIDRIDELSDKRFLALLKPYVEARYKQPGFRPAGLDTEEKFLAKALARKQSLRADMTRFYDSLAKERGLSGLQEAMTRHTNAAPAMVVRVS